MIETIEYKGETYPKFQSEGNAAKFVRQFALEVIKPEGKTGYDIGCNRKDWMFHPSALPIDPNVPDCRFDAYNLPAIKVDYIFSSHCLEHLRDWVEALDYWRTRLHEGGVLFLYLPDYLQKYWRVWNNRKHIHTFYPALLRDYLMDRGWKNVFVTGTDLNYSFTVIAEK